MRRSRSRPDHAGLRKCRAELRLQMDDSEGAAADAAEAVILDNDDPAAKALLGILMLELKRPADAVACLGEAVAIDPGNPTYREGLAAALDAAGDADAALATLIAGIAAAPGAGRTAQCRHPAVDSSARLHHRLAARRGGSRRRRHGRMPVRPDGPCTVQSRPPCGGRRRLCRGTEAWSGRSPMCGTSSLPRAPCRSRRAHLSSISAPCSTAMPIASSRIWSRLAIASRA